MSAPQGDWKPPRHGWLYALPEGRLPGQFRIGNVVYTQERVFKHDFFAATGLYCGPSGLVVAKFGRQSDFFSLPLDWIGRFLTRQERRGYARAEGLPGIPAVIGCPAPNVFVHAYVPGHPLERREAVSDKFFDELTGLVRALHAREMAYVDLNKRQNILVGEDGRPYLIDFQISFCLPKRGWGRNVVSRWLLRRLQRADCYHCLKHKRRLRPDLLTPDERAAVERLSLTIRLHRVIARPLTQLRRRILNMLSRTEDVEVPGSSAK